MSSFYAVLPSNSCPLTQPNNTAASYRVDFESHVELSGQWEVALTEVSFNYSPPIASPQAKLSITRKSSQIQSFSFEITDGKFYTSFITDDLKITTQGTKNTLLVHCLKPPFTIVFENLNDALKFGTTKPDITNLTPKYEFEKPFDVNANGSADGYIEYGEHTIISHHFPIQIK